MLLVDILATDQGMWFLGGIVILILMTMLYTKSCLSKHRRGGELDDTSTFVDGCILVAIAIVMADGAEFGGLAVGLAVTGVAVLAALRGVDRATKWWAARFPQRD